MSDMRRPRLLTGSDIMAYISQQKPPLITNYKLIRQQVQPAGFDLTLAKILQPKPATLATVIEFSRAKQVFLDEYEPHNFKDPCLPMHPYIFVSEEVVNLPLDITGFCINRSSLTKLGSILGSGVIDAGYRGNLSFSYIGTQPVRFKQGDKFTQLILFQHDATFAYTGQYQGVVR